ncbi:18349_t:CDS:2, partial [Racocetra persica]
IFMSNMDISINFSQWSSYEATRHPGCKNNAIVSTKYRARVHDNISINETSYMCEVLTRLFDTSMNGLPINCEAWDVWRQYVISINKV